MLDLLLCWRLTVQYARHIFIQRQTHTHERADERIYKPDWRKGWEEGGSIG